MAAGSVLDWSAPFALGLLCAAPPGWAAVGAAAGSLAGYCFFWREVSCWGWVLGGALVVLLAGRSPLSKVQPLLIPACAALVTSGCGVLFLLMGLEAVPIPVYLLRVLLSFCAAAVFQGRQAGKAPADWLSRGLLSFSLARIAPKPWLSLGFLAAGLLAQGCALPGAVLTGLGLDLAGVTQVSMAGVMCLSGLVRLAGEQPWLWAAPGGIYGALSLLTGQYSVQTLPALLLGGLLGSRLPAPKARQQRVSLSPARVRLEQHALLLDTLSRSLPLQAPPEDGRALMLTASRRACDSCPERKGCKARQQIAALPEQLLRQRELPAVPDCRKPKRLTEQLRLAQEQLRRLQGQRRQRESYVLALQGQYRLLSRSLRALSDSLETSVPASAPRYRVEAEVRSRALRKVSGDLFLRFSCGSTEYLLLCDGMGTGEEAARCSREAAGLLRSLLEAGATAEEALESYGALCILRDEAAACTLDLLQLELHSGTALLYKQGAPDSFLLRGGTAQKVGTAAPPPGSSHTRAAAERLSLGGEELLILLTDGALTEGALPQALPGTACAGEVAQAILEHSGGQDDATVAAVRLQPVGSGLPTAKLW